MIFGKKKTKSKSVDDTCYMGVIKMEEDGEKLYFGPVKTSGDPLTAKLNGKINFDRGALVYVTPEHSWESPEEDRFVEGKVSIGIDEYTRLLTGKEVINYFGNEDLLFKAIRYFDPVEPSKDDIKRYKKILKAKEKEKKRIEKERRREEKMKERERKRELKQSRPPLRKRIKYAVEDIKDTIDYLEVPRYAKDFVKGTIGLAGFLSDIDRDSIRGSDIPVGILGNLVAAGAIGGLAGMATNSGEVGMAMWLYWFGMGFPGQLGILAASEFINDKYKEYKEHLEDLKRKAKINSSICENYTGK